MMRRRPGPKPVEPLWPHGAIAQMVVVPAELSDTGQSTMGLRKLVVTNATKTAEGWRIVAQSPNKIVRFLDVDEEGIGDNCEPWDDELERKFGAADPEYNVVLLDNEEPAEPAGEVIDINLAKTRDFVRRVRAGMTPHVTELYQAAALRSQETLQARDKAREEQRTSDDTVVVSYPSSSPAEQAAHRANVDALMRRVARLITTAWTDELREGVKDAEAVVYFYSQLHPQLASDLTDKVNALLTEYSDLINALPLRNRPVANTREKRLSALEDLAQRGQELMGREPGSVTAAMVRGVARASARQEAERKEAASRQEEAEHHGNA